ncbi:MAG: hypothetical protein SV186_05495, partial [Candidatus Nanohaloarchaea archaeon]|nr:hypothetical protein [Candidatus Nanohaloarchaea archaeon]
LMFGAAIAPLLAVAWAIPGAKRYADPLISAWWAALLIGPLDMMILRLLLALLDPGNGIPHYIYAFAGLTLLLIVPYIVFSASGTMTGVAGGLVLSSLSKAGEKLPDKPTMKEESYSFAAPAYRTTGETKPSKQAMNSGPRVPRSQRGRQKPRSENKFSDHFDYLDIDDKRGDRQ